MKKIGLFLILACGWQTAAYAQETLEVDVLKVGGFADFAGIPPWLRKKSGIEIGDAQRIRIGEWEEKNVLSFAADGYAFTGGNVGIGTTYPRYKLDVNGDIHAKNVWFDELVVPSGNIGYILANLAVINGTLQATRATITGNLVATNATINENLLVARNLTIYGGLSAKNAQINGQLSAQKASITGDIFAQNATIYGELFAKAISVTPSGGADFVFNNDYHLKPLSEVNNFIKENKHLPEIPSAAEMTSKGVNVGEMQMKLLQKTEELTLYMIQQQETIEKQQKVIEALSAKIEKLENDKN